MRKWFLKFANLFVVGLLRAGVRLNGLGRYPMFLLTVRGRKSGLPRTVPIVLLVHEGDRFACSPYGLVDWVRNLRAAVEAVLTRGRRSERVRALELSPEEGAVVLARELQVGNPFLGLMGLRRGAQQQQLEAVVRTHPVFRMLSS